MVHTTGTRVLVGRFDRQDESGVHLIGVSIHDSSESSEIDFLARTIKFGVRVDRPHFLVPGEQVRQITALGLFQTS